MGKTVNSIGDHLTPLGWMGMNPLTEKGRQNLKDPSNLLKGKKDPGTPDEVIDLADPAGRSLQSQAIGQYGDFLNKDVGQMARNQSALLEKQAKTGADDQERLARQMVTQRGLGNSSVGLNAILNQKRDLGDKLGSIRANQPMLENQMKQQNLTFATGGINSILNEQGQSKVLKMGQESKGRQGGLLPILMGGAGAYMGGPGGAQAGYGMGQAMTQMG